jgi:transposase
VLKVKRRGPEVGSSRRLSSEQEMRLQKMISDNPSDQLMLAYSLWTRKAVMELIEQETGIASRSVPWVNISSAGASTPQKPEKWAYEQNPKALQRWLDEEYPAIKELAKKGIGRNLLGR